MQDTPWPDLFVAQLTGSTSRSPVLAMLAGVVLMGWIAAQVAIIGFVSWLQPTMAITGAVIVALATRMRAGLKPAPTTVGG